MRPLQPACPCPSGLTLTRISRLLSSDAALKQVETDLSGVSGLLKADASLHDFLNNPIISHADRSAGIDLFLKKASKTPSELTKNFFEVLAANGRLYESEKVIADFLDIMSAHRGEVKVTITSAVPLEKDIQKRLEDSLKQSIRAQEGKSLIVVNKVHEGLLGGLIIDFGDKTLDLSVQSKVNKLNTDLQGMPPPSLSLGVASARPLMPPPLAEPI